MKLKYLLDYIFDNVCIYKEVSTGEYETLYHGSYKDVPEQFLEMEVRKIGAKQTFLVDIELFY